MKTVYLAGNVGKSKDLTDVLSNFAAAEAILKSVGFRVLNPMRSKEAVYEQVRYDCNEIVHRDEGDIDRSDLLIAVMSVPEDGAVSIGTPMEICRAREVARIPVIVVAYDEVIFNHYWIKSKATKVVATFDEAVRYAVKWYLDSGDKV